MTADLSTRGARIIVEASRYIGLTEVLPNRKWDLLATRGSDPIADELVTFLLSAGWQPGWPYCAAFCEAVWRKAYADVPKVAAEIASILGPHCMTTWRNATAHGWTSSRPVRGAIGIMRHGSSDNGHAFIVSDPDASPLRTIEANTSANAGTVEADRNGDGIYPKRRTLDFTRTSGLYLVGFITPPAA